jgi:hypothetical protein
MAKQPKDDATFLINILDALCKRLPKKAGAYFQLHSCWPVEDIVPTFQGHAVSIRIEKHKPAPEALHNHPMPLIFSWSPDTAVLHIMAVLDFSSDAAGGARLMALEQYATEHNLSRPDAVGKACIQFYEDNGRSVGHLMTTLHFPPAFLKPRRFSGTIVPLVEATYRRLCLDAEAFAMLICELVEVYDMDAAKPEGTQAAEQVH